MKTTGHDLNTANKPLTSADKHEYGIIFFRLDQSNLSLAVLIQVL